MVVPAMPSAAPKVALVRGLRADQLPFPGMLVLIMSYFFVELSFTTNQNSSN